LALSFVTISLSSTAFGQSLVGRNTNAVGPTPDGFYKGIPHYQDNEPHCDRNPLLPSNILCMANGYGGADDLIGDAWPRILETQDNTRTWQSRYASGSAADPATDLGLGFGADPIMVCWAGACGGFFIASNRAPGGGSGGGVYMEMLPELNIESGFRHFSRAGGPLTVQLGTGDNFLDKIDAIFMLDTQNPGTVEVSMTVSLGKDELGNEITRDIVRQWPKGRLLVVYASLNSSQQNVRVFSTYSDDFGQNWSPPKQVANTTGLDTGVAVAAIDDTVFYAYRQFQDDSGDNGDAVYGAISTDRGKTIRKPFAVVDNLCPFDQPTLPVASNPNPPPFETVASRTNNFVDISNDGNRFVMVLANRLAGPGGCLSQPFDYKTGSRVLVTTARSDGKGWKPPIEIAPLQDDDPRFLGENNAHSFQIMPAVDCELGICQAIWYDSIRDSIRNVNYLANLEKNDAVDAFLNYPFFADFYYPRTDDDENLIEILQFRRTADVFTRQFTVSGSGAVSFRDQAPVQVSNYQLAAITPSDVVEVEQNPFGLKQYKGNTVSFMGDYICLASKKMRGIIDPGDPTGTPLYEHNYGPDPLNPSLDPSWFACWTDTRKARGQLYTQTLNEPVPFEKTNTAGGNLGTRLEAPDEESDPVLQPGTRKLSAEGVEDINPTAVVCEAPLNPPSAPGDTLFATDNRNRIKDADVYGALIEPPDTAWLLNARKGLGDIQRTYVIAARNEDRVIAGEPRPDPKTYRFRIMNQPVGWDNDGLDDARASWLQLPFENFDNQDPLQAPLEFVDEKVEPQSSVTVALFVVSALPINPVTVNVYEVPDIDAPASAETPETLVETLTVNGAGEAGNLIFISDNPALPNVNVREIHNPFVYAPTTSGDIDYANPEIWNPEIWNPEIWNPEIWNPEIWNPEIWNPEIWNPEIWNPEIWNPEIWNPEIWNVSLTDGDKLDNSEIPSPDVSGLESPDGLYAKFDVQFTAENLGNTTTPYTADFAANSPIVRQLLADGSVRTQIIVWQDVDLNSYQACDKDFLDLAGNNSPGQNRILAIANNEDLLNLKIPDIFNNRFGSVTYYAAPFEKTQITIRFVSLVETIRTIAPELVHPGISYVVTSQAANTGESNLDPGVEQAISDAVPPTMAINPDYLPEPIPLVAEKVGDLVGATLPASPPLVSATKEFETPVVTCSEDGLVNYGLGEFVPLGLGLSSLTCSATAANLAVGEINLDVDVRDEVDPVLGALPADAVIERTVSGGAPINYALPLATDEIDSDVAVTCGPIMPGGDLALFDAPGPTETTVTCTATDQSGNSDSGTFLVTVKDQTAPIITVPTAVSEDAASGSGANVTFAVSAVDVGTIVSLGCAPASGDLFPIGDTTVTCTATDDAGNSSVGLFDVTVSDLSSPTIDSVPASPFNVEANDPTGYLHPPGAPPLFEVTATDTVDGTIPAVCSPDGASNFLFGTTPVTCSAFDAAGNESPSLGFNVAVEDTTKPVIVLGESPLVRSTAGTFATIDYLANVTVTDNADDSIVPVCLVDGVDVGNPYDFPIDSTSTVECTATDSEANVSSASFDVTVNFAYNIFIERVKGNINTGSTVAIDWYYYEGADTRQRVDTSSLSPMVAWFGPYPDDGCGGQSNGEGDGFDAEDSGNSSIRYSFSDNSWRLNWQTPLFEGWYKVTISPPGGDAASFCEELKK
jgi:hypothetical protein